MERNREQRCPDRSEYEKLVRENKELREKLAQMEKEMWRLDSKLSFVCSSRSYKVSLLLKKTFDKLIPANSMRYRMVRGVWRKLKWFLKEKDGRVILSERQMEDLSALGKYKRMDILTIRHTMYIARLIKQELELLGIECRIHFNEPQEYEDIPYLIISPQHVKCFPKVYFAFQMEQTVSTRWFTEEYLNILRNACGVLDYSLTNIVFYEESSYRDILLKSYYMPIDYHAQYAPAPACYDKEYDVLFYGDVSVLRRKAILDELSKRFRVKICTELYGEDVYAEIRKTKVLLNVHYYEDALLETTRLYETLSLNTCMIVSEDSRHMAETDRLAPFVDFVPVGDMQALVERINYWVNHDEERIARVSNNQVALESRANAFRFYFQRFLLAHDRIDFETFYRLSGNYVQLGTERICLNLPEYTNRRKAFDQENRYGFECVPGLRHLKGWVGAGMSYKMIFRRAIDEGLARIMVCEDDVAFPVDFETRLREITAYLDARRTWSVFSGVMADLGNVKMLSCEEQGGRKIACINRMVSMVFNIYHRNMFEILASWDEQNRDVEKNAIDRYLEKKKLSVYVQIPFLVEHKEEMNSTIWNVSNMQYSQMIENCEKGLEEMTRQFSRAH